MSVVITDKLANDILWWLQHTDSPNVTLMERWTQGKTPMMEVARDSMVDELKEAIDNGNLIGTNPTVCLSLEEAKNLYKLVGFLKATLPIDAIFERCAIEELEERITKAEKLQ